MVIIQTRSKRKPSGGRYKSALTKRVHAIGRAPTYTRLGELAKTTTRKRGGKIKEILLYTDTANVYNTKTKKYQKVKIKNISESPANRNFVKRNILTKGAVIDTEIGKAKVTSRPGQEGTVNAVLI